MYSTGIISVSHVSCRAVAQLCACARTAKMAHGKELFLKAFAFVYLFAFTSLYPQINGTSAQW